jgi:hypothetical protein
MIPGPWSLAAGVAVDVPPALDHGARPRGAVPPVRDARGLVSVGVVVIRCFGEVDDAPRVSRALELVCAPARGQKIRFSDAEEAVFVDRVVQHPLEPGAWTPGLHRLCLDVLMAPEPADGLSAALGTGWTAA